MTRKYVLIANNAGLVTTTGAATLDLVHTLSPGRSALIHNFHAYNNTGLQQTIIIGTQDNSGVALFVPLFPAITCPNGQDTILTEDELLQVEFRIDRQATVNGRTGNICIVASAAGAGGVFTVRMTIAEIG